MPVRRAFGVGKTPAGHRLGALDGWGVGGVTSPPFQCISARPRSTARCRCGRARPPRRSTSSPLRSQRVDRFDDNIANIIGGTKKSSITFAPEAGTQRLRDIINKGLTNEVRGGGGGRAREGGPRFGGAGGRRKSWCKGGWCLRERLLTVGAAEEGTAVALPPGSSFFFVGLWACLPSGQGSVGRPGWFG